MGHHWLNWKMITGTEAEYQSDAGYTKDTPYLEKRASSGVNFVTICENIYRVIAAPHYMHDQALPTKMMSLSVYTRLCMSLIVCNRWLFHSSSHPFTSNECLVRYGNNTLNPEQNGRNFADDIFTFIFVNGKLSPSMLAQCFRTIWCYRATMS